MTSGSASPPFMIGVTGNIACGKSAVVEMLAEMGATAIDSDRVYHELIQPGQPLWTALRDHFGPSIVSMDGSINRRALSQIVFSDPVQLAALDVLTHPAVVQAIQRIIATSNTRVVAVDAVKLVESGMAALCNAVWLVECSPGTQLRRLMARNGFTEDEARRRISAQPDLVAKRSIANEIIDNSGSLEETRRQVDAAWSRVSILPI